MLIKKHDLLAYDGLKIFQSDEFFKFSIDALLLGDFVEVNKRAKNIIDLGSGLGAVSLYLSLKTKANIIGVEIQKEVFDLANKSLKYNQLDHQIKYYHHDAKTIYQKFETNTFDIVVSNPPFFKTTEAAFLNDLEALSLSRHEISLSIHDVFEVSKKLLKPGGKLYFIHRVERLDEIILALERNGFVAKRLKFVYTKPQKTAKMLLVEARFSGSKGSLVIEEPLYIYDENTKYTKAILDIFHLGDENYEKTL